MVTFYFYKTRASLGVFGFSLLFLIVSGWYENSLHKQVKDLTQRLFTLNQLAIRQQEVAALIKVHQADFEKFEACEFGRRLTPEILQSSCPHAIEFGAISSLNQLSKFSTLVFQEVSFSILCLKDRDVFTFLDQLIHKGPGIFQIHDVTITRIGSLSEEMLEKIAAGKPQVLFESRVSATWIHQ